jgi:REP element-mobilizing transposase RayT
MSRQRDLTTSEWFHIVQKGADRQDLFSATSHRTVYAELIAQAFDRFRIELHAYAWMTNHVHHLVHAPDGGLPEAMHLVGSRYASIYNGWTDRSGPLFTARYFSEPITSDEQLAQTARYIHRNPLPIVRTAGLVEYRWSSLGQLCGRRPIPAWLATGVVLAGFDADSYRRYVLSPQPGDRLGKGALPPSTPTSCAEIEWAVAAATGRPIDDLRAPNRKASDAARTVMITLAVDFRAADSATLADRYGLSDLRSVRRIARRGRALATQSPTFASLRYRVITLLDHVGHAGTVVPGDLGPGNQRGSRRPGRGELRRAG